MIDKQLLEAFRKDFAEAMKPLEKKYNLSLKLGRITYGEDSFNGKLEAFDRSEGESREAKEFQKHCTLYGLEPTDLGKTIVCDGDSFKIVGLNPSKRKYCIQAVRLKDNKSFGLTLQATKEGLARLNA